MSDPDDLPRVRRGDLHLLLTIAMLVVAALALAVALGLYNCPWLR